MRQRVEGRATRHYSAEGKEILSYREYCEWLVANIDDFYGLYLEWVKSEYDSKLIPSIDRINNDKGYTAENMQWLSLTKNSQKFNK